MSEPMILLEPESRAESLMRTEETPSETPMSDPLSVQSDSEPMSPMPMQTPCKDVPSSHPSTSRDGIQTRRGTGKGGKSLQLRKHKLVKALSRDEMMKRREQWQVFLTGFKSEINQLLVSFPKTSHFECPDCQKLVIRNALLCHSTSQGCTKMRRETKLKNCNKTD